MFPTQRDRGAGLPALWADFTRAITLYPPTNSRVEESIQRFLTSVAEVCETDSLDNVPIVFSRHHYLVFDFLFDLPADGKLAWLKQLLDSAFLAGVAFEPEATSESIREFTCALTGTNEMLSFERRWPQEFNGIRLIDRRFARTGFDHDPGDGEGEDNAEQRIIRTWDLSEVVGAGDLAAILTASPEVRRSLEGIRANTAELEGETKRVDLVAELVARLPADVRDKPDEVQKLIAQVLRQLEEQTAAGQTNESGNKSLNEQMIAVSHRLFARAGKSASTIAQEIITSEESPSEEGPSAPRGHAGDDAVTDDWDLLVKEVEALPAERPVLDRQAANHRAEQLGALLHLFVTLRSGHAENLLRKQLIRMSRNPTRAERTVLMAYLTDSLTGEKLRRMVNLLTDAGLGRLLRFTGKLRDEAIVRQFPLAFGLYLDSLTRVDISELHALEEICRRIGSRRIRESARQLVVDERILEGARASVLLARDALVVRAFAEAILMHGGLTGRRVVTQFAARLPVERVQKEPLHILSDLDSIPQGYLEALVAGTSPLHTPKVRREISELICDEIRAGVQTASTGELTRAIRALRKWHSRKAVATLREFVFSPLRPFRKVPRQDVRRTAREVLKSMPRGRTPRV